MLLLILKSFRFWLLKGYCLPPLHKAKILLGCLLSTEVNDCDIINSHKKCRAGLFIYNKAVTVKKFSLPITQLFCLFSFSFQIFYLFYLMKDLNVVLSETLHGMSPPGLLPGIMIRCCYSVSLWL